MDKEFVGIDPHQGMMLGHPTGLFVLFFTEMWERFSYYGMRAIFVLFLTASFMDGGWEWPRENALALLGTYASLVYLTPIAGGALADQLIGYRRAIVIGASVMALGHAAMAVETPTFLYIGIGLLIIGNGFFKPNMTAIISHMYKNHQEKKDGAFTIYYMGVNAGAFLGIMLCGYLGEKVGWSWGFGLAGIFMLLGMLQFYFAQDIFGTIGLPPGSLAAENDAAAGMDPIVKSDTEDILDAPMEMSEVGEATEEVIPGDKPVPFTNPEMVLIAIMTIMGLAWIFNDPYSKISGGNLFNFSVGSLDGSTFVILSAFTLFVGVVLRRLMEYAPIVRDRMIVVVVFAFFTVFFWAAFEQAAGSMVIFARDYTQRTLEGNAAMAFKIINTFLTVVPLGIITWVLISMFTRIFDRYALSNIILGTSFLIIWGIVIRMLWMEFSNDETEIPASWFSILNALFIIVFAPLFSRIWESKYNPSGAHKFAAGLILLGIGFAALAYGASTIPQGAETAAVSMVWLIIAYLFHTLGELCLSPVGLSYVSKLVPARMIAFMFGIWYLAIAIGNKLAHTMGGKIDDITAEYSLSFFFLIFTVVPLLGGLILVILNPLMKKLMHGIE